ncbi:MAG TPA: hypothetical protein PK711_12195 [Bacteroidales bacterium]|nr:hypothetical protein [Bacteroidales bacterium]HRZ21492.1 hypothetical protein [Bacteroidales bacterium]
MIKHTRYILPAFFMLIAGVVSGQAYFSITYDMAAPLGNTKEFIPKFNTRGFGIEAGGRFTDHFAAGMGFAWNGFYQELDYEVYGPEDGLPDGLNMWTPAWKYITVYPFYGSARYYLYSHSGMEVYAGAIVGTSLISQVTDYGVYSQVSKNWHLTLAPEAGIIYWLHENIGITFNSRFMWSPAAGNTDAQTYLGFNVGVIASSIP